MRIAEDTVLGMAHLKARSLRTEAAGIASRSATPRLPQAPMS